MRRFLIATFILTTGVFLSFPAKLGAQSATASIVAEPRLQLPVRITVMARQPMIELVLPAITGEITSSAEFGVEGNTPRVLMYVEATALYFKGDIANQAVAPIPLQERNGVEIDAQGATVENQGGTRVPFVGPGDVVDQYPTKKTGEITFKSSDPYTFIHPVIVTLTWLQENPNKPAGQYKGKIKLTCMALAPP